MIEPTTAKKVLGLKGETRIGRNGKKKRSTSKGIRMPTPSPPLVTMSKSPCEAAAAQAAIAVVQNDRAPLRSALRISAPMMPSTAAKASE